MIVLSVGMPRAGSGWHYNLIHDLMEAAGYIDARVIREKYRLQNILTEVNCNIGVLSVRRMGMVAVPAVMGKDFDDEVRTRLLDKRNIEVLPYDADDFLPELDMHED